MRAPLKFIIKPRPGWHPIDLAELWRFRELLWFLALRDIKVRYKQTVLGAAWAVIQPVLAMVVFSVFFGKLGGFSSRVENGIPYPLYTFAALLPWQLFSRALTESANSLVIEQRLITKVYFPRVIVPLAPVLAALLDFLIAFVILLGMMAWYGVWPDWRIVTLPLFVLLTILTCLAVGLWLSALNAIYRDVRYTLPFLTQMWLFASPVAYPSSIVPAQWRWLYGLNPMAGVIDGFRWALLGKASPPSETLWVAMLATVLLLVGGLYYFRSMERFFADVV
ncbi:MAG: ABC transporter permease [Verrucomicrobiia bacterium]|jgi:lipopolysaccharide transport system permease protein